MKNKLITYIGTWASDLHEDAVQKEPCGGIRVYETDERTGELRLLNQVAKDINAGIFCVSSDRKYLYSTDERKDRGGLLGAGGGVYSFRIDQETGNLAPINSQSSVGPFPCYLDCDPNGEFVVVCNHGHHFDVVSKVVLDEDGIYRVEVTFDDGSVALLPVAKDGAVKSAAYVDTLEPYRTDVLVKRDIHQKSPHPHSVHVDPLGQYVLVCDKGTDEIRVYDIDRASMTLRLKEPVFHAEPVSGPRHLVFHPDGEYFFVNSEINSTIHSYRFEAGEIEEVGRVRTIPDDYKPVDPDDHFAANETADLQIHPDGKFLYVTNRGMETVAAFRVNCRTGQLTLIGYYTSGGRVPRAIAITPDGAYLYIANQKTGEITRYQINQKTGELENMETLLTLDNPVCIRFLELE